MPMQLYEWEEQAINFDPADVESYLQQVWDKRPMLPSRYSDASAGGGDSSRKQRFLTFGAGSVRARNYVGFVQYEDTRIDILPRVFKGRALSTPKQFQHLLTWLSYGRRIHFPSIEQAFSPKDCPDNWLEALIYLFASYATSVLPVSPYHQYEEVSEETCFLKGRLNMPRFIQHQLATGHHHHLYCDYAPFVYDNTFNRIVKSACTLLSHFTEHSTNRALLSNLLFILDEVSDMSATGADCDRLVLSRLHPEKTLLKNFCKLFLDNSKFDAGQASDQALCVLIPMEVLFEEFSFGVIESSFGNLNPRRQASDIYLAETGKDWNTKVFELLHDILIPGRLIIDTKYKFRELAEDSAGGVDQGDLYQMLAYAYRRGLNQVLLLYPHIEGADNGDRSFRIVSGLNNVTVQVEVRSLDIVVDDMASFEKILRERVQQVNEIFKLR